MGQIKWYKRDPSAALNGMMELDLQERGAYNTVLDLIYSRDGNLPDDDRFIAGWLRVDVRVWKRIKSTLIERGKLSVENGILRNERADVEVLAALSRVASAQDAGRASARSKSRKYDAGSNKNSNLDATPVETPVETTVATNHNHNQKDSAEANASTGGEPPKIDIVKVIFDTGNSLLTGAGYDQKNARSIIGRWRKTFGDPAVLVALSQAQVARPQEPVEWITGALRSSARMAGGYNGNQSGNGGAASGYRADRRDSFSRAIDESLGLD